MFVCVRLGLVDKAFLSWVLDKEGANLLGKLRSVWKIFFLHDPDLSGVLTQQLLDDVSFSIFLEKLKAPQVIKTS